MATTKKEPAAKAPAKKAAPRKRAPAKPKQEPAAAEQLHEYTDHEIAFADQLRAQLGMDRSVALAFAHAFDAEDGEDLAQQVTRARADLDTKNLHEGDASYQAKKLGIAARAVDSAQEYLANR